MKIDINLIKENTENPRTISVEKLKLMKRSLEDFPEMLSIRPIILNSDYIIIGGNIRYKAARELGWSEVDVEFFNTEQEKEYEFLIKDNLNYGEWSWVEMSEDYKYSDLLDWGAEAPIWFKNLNDEVKDNFTQPDKSKEKNTPNVSTKKAYYLFYSRPEKEELSKIVKKWATPEECFLDFIKNNI
jgi:hypothetical protein